MRKINIVLYQPEIAQNVGAIMRTCVAIDARLHLIEPFGFIYDDRHLARPSANEHQFVDVVRYDDWNDFISQHPQQPLFCLSRYGQKPISDFDFKKLNQEVYLMFGKESTGIPKQVLIDNIETTFRIPMVEQARSINIANTVGIASYEVLRQWDYLNLSKEETQKGRDYLLSGAWVGKED
ncbi:tRNA (cytidine(34)-2'-O)-methyltransferase [Williamsoniiplasma luminosum]|uniref:Putative tRNA (cytidine(34)-2'-O)-methyltransferase n=1 Tax=Williamsoniiplasma luminosum TaxID=214888 RepID=A0A2S0NJ99_9MOLU|nr:tRNA (cytidine(34)-2'-O)-methyltransferase [Williamsoniiplasma luminosum]AVP49088.1 MAG: RNA methyltransferase [Williamsoniiplasma luminosum]